MNKVNKSIGWADYSINPVKGKCPMACDYCYARAMYKRFKWNPEIRFDFGVMDLFDTKPASKFFIGSTMELFGEWVKDEWLEDIFRVCADWSGHTFIFLTKRPSNLLKWSPFPNNFWIGVSVNNSQMVYDSWPILEDVWASVKFYSFEPLHEAIEPDLDYMLELAGINWVIIGAQTPYSVKTAPREIWVREITDTAVELDIPVYHKDNLGWIFDADGFPRRREFPGNT